MGKEKKQHEGLNFWQKFGLFFYDKKILTLVIWVVSIVFGALSYTTFMRREGFPSVDVPLGVVQVISFDGDAEKVDASFAQPLIEAARQDDVVKDVLSTTTDQGSAIQISYADGTDVQKALDDLKARVGDKLPQNGQVVYVKVNASKLTVEGDDVLISVHGDGLTTSELDAAAERLMPILREKVALASDVHIYKSIETVTDPATGQSDSAQVRFDRFYDKDTAKPLPSVAVGVAGVEGADQLELYDQIKAALSSEQASDIGADSEIAVDFAESIREQVSGLQQNLLEGLIVVLIVSFVLISLRGSAVTALSMATTVIITIGILQLIGYTINTITLFSLVLCLALIVDDTTIIVEAIDAGLKKGRKFRDIVAESLKKIARASATGTLTTMLAFAPMLFIGGILGKFIRAIPVTIIISLAVSIVVSFVFIPLFMKLSYGKNATKKDRKKGMATHFEERVGGSLAALLTWSTRTKARSIATKLHAVFIAIAFIIAGGMIFKTVEFNIFPAPKDGIEILLSAQRRDQESATIETTQLLADEVLNDVKEGLGENLEKMTLLSQNSADRNGFMATLRLTPLGERTVTSVELAQKLQDTIATKYPDLNITVESAGVGPPEGNFTVQVKSDNTDASRKLATDAKTFLETTTLKRLDGTTARLTDVTVTPSVVVSRKDGARVISVSAGFDAKDVSALVALAEDAVKEEFTPERVSSYGLESDALQFDFGQEEENQESFASMGRAAGPLFFTMFLLMALLFRSVMQPLLILMALPFAFFGVAAGLKLTDNPLSFFTMLGIFALIGISLNNSVLLTDYANQSQKAGLKPAEAMSSALKARLRPLLTTSITSVLALLPLALNDPFWEGLAFALIFGLLSSTILVILVFPYFYLIEEGLRVRVRRLFRRPI